MQGDPRDRVLREVKEKGIRFIQLWFTDLLGNPKSVEITAAELEEALGEGFGFDGSSIHGFARIDESDMLVRPDPNTFSLLPWGEVARVICDVLEPDGGPYKGDPRWALKRALAKAKEQGFVMNVGPEVEYFYFRSDSSPETLDSGGYFDLVPPDLGSKIRRETVRTLEDMGVGVEATHHEAAPSQQEIDLRYDDALLMADNLMTCRLVIKEVAHKHGVYATFMPKPIFGQNGSGMHLHQSLFHENGGNAFFEKGDPLSLSPVAKGYIAGILRHVKEIMGVCAQWVNSYKRLVPGYEAPVYITWSHCNRSNMIRVPTYKPGKESASRVEFRAPDAACNPYLTFAVLLHAGLAGIEHGYSLPEPVEENAYVMNEQERAKRGIDTLPGSLNEAIAQMEKSELVHRALGDHIFEKFIQNKKIEWDAYRSQVHSYELERYLAVL
ncbi:MAG: glutamine synthetase family protein [Candidatus Bipolaricaulota bacterium]|nr:glutamine synthetase family protein [Candidatus Bipolaricaulota bacterium]